MAAIQADSAQAKTDLDELQLRAATHSVRAHRDTACSSSATRSDQSTPLDHRRRRHLHRLARWTTHTNGPPCPRCRHLTTAASGAPTFPRSGPVRSGWDVTVEVVCSEDRAVGTLESRALMRRSSCQGGVPGRFQRQVLDLIEGSRACRTGRSATGAERTRSIAACAPDRSASESAELAALGSGSESSRPSWRSRNGLASR
jgi:hypothetical protein